MITFFTAPKPFRGHIGVIQRNAIESWTRAAPSSEVILFGDEEGTAEVARELNVRHTPEVAKNEYGTPLVSSLFEKAQKEAKYDVLCYINADIILMSDFMKAVQQVIRWSAGKPFLLVGRRWALDMNARLDFDQPAWEKDLRALLLKAGYKLSFEKRGLIGYPAEIWSRWGGRDYFVFPRGLWKSIPPFAVGRPPWDIWMIYKARSMHVSVIDSMTEIIAVHQNHDYSHVPHRTGPAWEGPETEQSTRMVGQNFMTLEGATHVLLPQRVEPMPSTLRLYYFFKTLQSEYSTIARLIALQSNTTRKIWNKIRRSK